MACTNKTHDVAVSAATEDARTATECARKLRRCGLRVQLLRTGTLQSSARTTLTLVNQRTMVADVMPGRVWDARSWWADTAAWRRFSAELRSAGSMTETQIDSPGTLAPSQLRRSTIDSYDHIATQFAEQWFEHPPARELEHFQRRLRSRSRVLDAGCGPGHHALMLSKSRHDVAGIDLSDGMLAQARKRTHGIHLVKMDLEALQFPDGTFDAIWCAAAILHTPREHLVRVLEGFRRVLVPSGTLGLNFQVGRRSEVVQRGNDRRFFEYYDKGAVAALLRSVGFCVDDALYGETTRNTHGLDLTLKWSTIYATRSSRVGTRDGRLARQDRQAQLALALAPGEKVDILEP